MAAKTKNNKNETYDKFFQTVAKLAKETQNIANQAVDVYSPLVEHIIKSKSNDTNEIEHTLDYMLDYCFDDKILMLYKKLCRYYILINPETTVFYINSYREIWDSESIEKPGKSHKRKINETGPNL